MTFRNKIVRIEPAKPQLPEWLWPLVADSLAIAAANRPALEDCLPISDEAVIEYKQHAPFLPAEVHNHTKIDPDAAMAAVRSLCG